MKVDLKKLKIEFLSYLKSERGFSEHTIKSYSNDISIFIDFCSTLFPSNNIDLEVIEPKTISHFKGKEIEKKYSSKTINRRMSAIKSFFKYLYNFEKIKDNPAVYIRSQKVNKELPDFVPESKIKELMKEPIKNPITNELEGQRDQAILELFYSTGLRLSELLSINICDIDRKNEIVKVMGKGGKERVVPIGKVALNSIEIYLKKLGKSIREYFEDPLFVNKKGKG